MSEGNITLIELLDALDEECKDIEITPDNMYDCIIDFGIPLEKRIEALDKYYRLKGVDTLEVINRLIGSYNISGVKSIEDYLYNISISNFLQLDLRLHIAKEMATCGKYLGFSALEKVLSLGNLTTPVRYEAICILMRSPDFTDRSTELATQIITDHAIECEYRYKCVLSLDFTFENVKTNNILEYRYSHRKPDAELDERNREVDKRRDYFQSKLGAAFILDSTNMSYYRILAGQLLLQRHYTEYVDKLVSDVLLYFCNDTELDYNIRADAADVLLRLSKLEETKRQSTEIIMSLGGNAATVYENKQNVHMRAIEESAMEGVDFLNKVDLIKGITFEYICSELERHPLYEEKVKITLKRIELDRALYSAHNLTLMNILVRLWCYICMSDYTEEMKARLVEELISASGTCSSGIVSRMVNVMSGFGDFSIRISWEDQIIGNLAGRLNSAINAITDEEKKALILEEMSIAPRFFEKRLNFLTFFRENISDIFEEIRKEFKEDLTAQDFDLYLRKAIAHYEGEY